MKQLIAIPVLEKCIAPCFEAAMKFNFYEIIDNKTRLFKTVDCNEAEGFKRVRILRLHDIDILICGGIKDFYLNILAASDIRVFYNISEKIDDSLKSYFKGKLNQFEYIHPKNPLLNDISHEQMLIRAGYLFTKHGYHVRPGPGKDFFLIDLIAEINCPVCGKKIRVAICCGAHTYRLDQEISEFHHLAKSKYDVRVYIYPDNRQVKKYCQEYGIELINPDSKDIDKIVSDKKIIPLLQNRIEGHEKASCRKCKNY